MAAEIALTGPTPLQNQSNVSANGHAPHDVERPARSEDELSKPDESIADIEKGPLEPEQPQNGEQRQLVEFDGPNDPGNPKNWSQMRRWAITCSMSSLVFTVTFASSIFSVNIGVVRDKFDVSIVTATLGVALFVLVCSSPMLHFNITPQC
jgi:hypothetical protein